MDTSTLLNQLRQERAELDATISVLERRAGAVSVGGSRKPKKHGRPMSAAAKLAMSKKLKAVWAAKKKASAARSKAAKARVAKKAS